jgi:hypothetical protein
LAGVEIIRVHAQLCQEIVGDCCPVSAERLQTCVLYLGIRHTSVDVTAVKVERRKHEPTQKHDLEINL